MKRFTETQKWEDPWFRRLTPEMKLLWQWLCDKCDNAGVIDPDIDLASFQIGYQYPSDTLAQFGERLTVLDSGKLWIPSFIPFQCGKLSDDCAAHKPILQSLEKHGIDRVSIGYQYPLRKGKGIGKGKESSKRTKTPQGTIEEMRAYAVEIGLPESDGESMFDHWESNGWKNGSNKVKCWKAGIRKWKSQGWLPSQKQQGNSKPAKQQQFAGTYEDIPLV